MSDRLSDGDVSPSMAYPRVIFQGKDTTARKKPAPVRGGLDAMDGFGDQPRVRERIMKLSKVYSATCHHRYSSER